MPWRKILIVPSCMLLLTITSFEVVKEGRILNSGLVVIPTKHHKVQSGYSGRFWDIISGWQNRGSAQNDVLSKIIKTYSRTTFECSNLPEVKKIDFGK